MRPCFVSTAASRAATITLAAVLAACPRYEPGEFKPAEGRATGAAAASVTIMTFNVENLFDTRHDAGKDDLTYLPKSAKQTAAHREACNRIDVDRWRDQCLNWDWNEDVLHYKLGAIADAILQVDGGRGPDIVALQEVENLAVLERLRTGYLEAAGYRPAILIEGGDSRGIDVAFLSRLPLVGKPALHPMSFADADRSRAGDTRGILEATFELPDGSLLTGYSVHFPAPYHPTEMRVRAYRALNRLKRALPPDRAVFAAGDFNTTSTEDRMQNMLDRFARPDWIVTHEDCASCPGTNYYRPRDEWSFLDMILYAPANRGADATWQVAPGSSRLANLTPAQTSRWNTPARFEIDPLRGLSDHWPLIVKLELQENQ
jgi:endonuclease/exonuclease/phosphatase family metal-dependent hydrolase